MPLRKEYLSEQLWGISYDPRYDARFYKMIERLKKTQKVSVTNKNNAYFIKAV